MTEIKINKQSSFRLLLLLVMFGHINLIISHLTKVVWFLSRNEYNPFYLIEIDCELLPLQLLECITLQGSTSYRNGNTNAHTFLFPLLRFFSFLSDS